MTGLPVLLNVLKNEKDDKEMVRGSLECLNQLVAPVQVYYLSGISEPNFVAPKSKLTHLLWPARVLRDW